MYLWISYTIKDYPPQKILSISARATPKARCFYSLVRYAHEIQKDFRGGF